MANNKYLILSCIASNNVLKCYQQSYITEVTIKPSSMSDDWTVLEARFHTHPGLEKINDVKNKKKIRFF